MYKFHFLTYLAVNRIINKERRHKMMSQEDESYTNEEI